MIEIPVRFTEIHADDLSFVKKKLESLGFKLSEIKPQTIGGESLFWFSITGTLEIKEKE